MRGVFENVTKQRHKGGWVDQLKRHVTLDFFKQQFSENSIMSEMIFKMSPMILFASILTIVVNKLRHKK